MLQRSIVRWKQNKIILGGIEDQEDYLHTISSGRKRTSKIIQQGFENFIKEEARSGSGK